MALYKYRKESLLGKQERLAEITNEQLKEEIKKVNKVEKKVKNKKSK